MLYPLYYYYIHPFPLLASIFLTEAYSLIVLLLSYIIRDISNRLFGGVVYRISCRVGLFLLLIDSILV
jgi:hypothetical protein